MLRVWSQCAERGHCVIHSHLTTHTTAQLSSSLPGHCCLCPSKVTPGTAAPTPPTINTTKPSQDPGGFPNFRHKPWTLKHSMKYIDSQQMNKKSLAGSVSFTVLATCLMFVDSDTPRVNTGPRCSRDTRRGWRHVTWPRAGTMVCCIFSLWAAAGARWADNGSQLPR